MTDHSSFRMRARLLREPQLRSSRDCAGSALVQRRAKATKIGWGRRASPNAAWVAARRRQARMPDPSHGDGRPGRLDGQDLELEPATRGIDLGNLAATKTEDGLSEWRGDRDPAGCGVGLERAH